MFTGLIETISKVTDFKKNSDGAIIQIDCDFSNEVKIGDSISLNGTCLTVVEINGNLLSFQISKETLNIADFNDIKKSDYVNVERAMIMNSRLDGHIVSGHIDGKAKIKSIKSDGFSNKFEFSADNNIMKYIVKKGSVAINGISLTVAEVYNDSFSVEIIPHTLKNTNLQYKKTGDFVNIETDILSRYVEKFLYLNNNNSSLSMQILKDNGYL